MTVLQQENRVHGAAKKAVAHQRQDELTQGGVCRGCATMPRLARKWGQWFAQAANIEGGVCYCTVAK